jgi:transcriptional regulator of PTS gene
LVRKESDARGIRRVDLAYVQLASSEIARDINHDVVLELIRARQPISRAELARLSGLQRSTVSNITDQLIAERWVCEGAVARLPRGRRPTMLVLNDDLVMLVADIRPRLSTVAVIDLNGRFLSRSQLPLTSDPARSVAGIVNIMKRMQDHLSAKSFEGIGVSLPGRVDPRSQRLIFAPNLAWPDYDIKGAIERETGLPVELDNAANACLLAETWFGRMDGIRNAVLVTISEGIGTGILANGQMVSGFNGMAGEFGHMPLDPDGLLCGCKAKGCWETVASSRAALRYYAETGPTGAHLEYHDLLRLADEGDARAVKALEKQAELIGKGLRLITAALSPEVILIAGDLVSSWQRFAPILERHVAAQTLAGAPPRIVATHETEVARLRGAAVLVLQRNSSHHLPPVSRSGRQFPKMPGTLTHEQESGSASRFRKATAHSRQRLPEAPTVADGVSAKR